ncbi:MAG: hypothetical protein R3E66_19740 [bacterium]
MNDKRTRALRVGVNWVVTSVMHTLGVGVYAFALAYVVAPSAYAWRCFEAATAIDELRDTSLLAFGLHVALSACLWALTYIAFQLIKLRRSQRKLAVVRATRGSVMTETIVILPVWMLLVFGMLQLAVNNVGGILANVAVYEAARTAWVWKGEVGKRANVTDAIVADRARIAAAMVMTPVAVGDFASNPTLPAPAAKMRNALALAHVPILSEAVAGVLPGGAQDFLAGLGSFSFTLFATRNNQSVWRALDGDPFIIRTLKKFTFAYNCTKVEVSEDGGRTVAKLTYNHQIAMPAMGPVFGELKLFSAETGYRSGYYTTFKRTSGRASQSNNPANAALPSNFFQGILPGNSSENELRGSVGFWD